MVEWRQAMTKRSKIDILKIVKYEIDVFIFSLGSISECLIPFKYSILLYEHNHKNSIQINNLIKLLIQLWMFTKYIQKDILRIFHVK